MKQTTDLLHPGCEPGWWGGESPSFRANSVESRGAILGLMWFGPPVHRRTRPDKARSSNFAACLRESQRYSCSLPSHQPKVPRMLLLNPRHLVRNYPDQRSREIMEKTIAFFERKGLTQAQGGLQRRGLVCGLHRVLQAGGYSRFADDPRPTGQGRRKRRLGHLARLRLCRNSRLLRPVLLVRLSGLGARHRPDLDEQQQGWRRPGPSACSTTATSSPSDSRKRNTAPTSTRRT